MWKYIKVSLVLFLTALVCALGVAGINYLTSPIIENYKAEKKAEAYREVFPEFDASKSEFITEGFKSDYIREKVIVRSATADLGYAFDASGKNTYGTISMVVGFDTEGNLLKLVLTENTQTGGRNETINNWVSSFETGMSPQDINNKPVASTATIGSNLVKNILNGCLADLGIKTEIQKELESYFGEQVSMSKTAEEDIYYYAQNTLSGYIVRDNDNNLLGYFYNIKVGTETHKVALDADFKALENSSNNELALEIALNEAKNNVDENLALELYFGEFTDKKDAEGKLDSVDKYLTISNNDEVLGSYVVSQAENDYGLIKLGMCFDAEGNLLGALIIEATQTESRNISLSKFIASLTEGMTGDEMINHSVVAGATFASNTAKDILANGYEQVTGTRPQKGYDEFYASLFEGVDLSKSTEIKEFSEATKDGEFLEGKQLNDSNGNLLGYGFILRSTKNQFDGYLELMVGVQPNGKFGKSILLGNYQTGGYGSDLNDYHNKFTPGMSSTDVNNVDKTSATLGSNQYKALIIMAMKEVGSYEEFYLQAFSNMTSYVSKETISNENIEEAVTVYNGETKLGTAYIVRIENVFSWHIFMVALDNNGNLIKVVDVDNYHPSDGEKADITEHLNKFTPGMTFDDIDSFDITNQHATYTLEQIKIAVKIAMIENGYEENNDIDRELLIKKLFPNAVWANTEELTSFTNKGNIGFGYKVWSSELGPDWQSPVGYFGYAYLIEVENDDISIQLLVGVDNSGNYINSILVNFETKRLIDDSAFGDTLQARLVEYLTTFTKGMTENDIRTHEYKETAAYSSQLIKYAIRLAMHEATSDKFYINSQDLYNNNAVLNNVIDGIDLSKSESLMTEEFTKNNPLIIDAIKANSSTLIDYVNGKPIYKTLGYVYIVDLLGIYSHNYVLVFLNADGTLNKIYDVENNHGALGEVTGFFENGMNLEDINNIDIHPTPESHASFTIEQGKLAVKVAMAAHGITADSTTYELAAKTLFPFMVEARSIVIKKEDIKDEKIIFAQKVYGTNLATYTDGVLLGYVYVTEDSGLKAMIAVDKNGNYNGAYVLTGDKEAFNDIKVGLTLAEALALEAGSVREILVNVLTESRYHVQLTQYDDAILEIFKSYSAFNSTLRQANVYEETELVVEIKDLENNHLGYYVVNKLTNGYSWHRFGVALDKDFNLIKVNDLGNDHGSGAQDITAQLNMFTPGMTLEDVNAMVATGSTFTIELIRLGVEAAMHEAFGTANKHEGDLFNEMAVKKTFDLAVWDKCKELEAKNKNVLFAANVYGTEGYDGTVKELGYAYIVRIENVFSWHIFGVALDTDGNLIRVVDIDNYHPSDNEKADITEHLNKFTSGMSFEDINNFDITNQHATYTLEQIKLAVKIAMIEKQNLNNHDVENEVALKTLLNNAVWNLSEKIETFKNEAVKDGYVVWSSQLGPDFTTPIGKFALAYIIELDGKKVMVALDIDTNEVLGVYDYKLSEVVENLEEYQTLIDIAVSEGGNK